MEAQTEQTASQPLLLEPLIGRQWAADPQRGKLSRTDKRGRYERLPMDQPGQTTELKKLQENGAGIRLRLREDLPPSVAKHFTKEPYVAGYCEKHDPHFRMMRTIKSKTFKKGQAIEVQFADGVWLLTHETHALYLEEVPPVDGPGFKATQVSSDVVGKMLKEQELAKVASKAKR